MLSLGLQVFAVSWEDFLCGNGQETGNHSEDE